MIREFAAPSDRAASTNSRSRIDSTWPRTMRATDAQLKKPMTRTVDDQAGAGDRDQRDGDEQERDRQDDVDQPGQHGVDDAAEEAGGQPDRRRRSPRSAPSTATPTSSEMRAP